MGLGNFIANAYDVGTGYDNAVDRQRGYRARQLETEQLNRNEEIRRVELERMKAMRNQAAAPQAGQYDVASVPTLPVLPVAGASAAAPAAPAVTPDTRAPVGNAVPPTGVAPTQSEVARFQSLTPAERMAELKRINAERRVAVDRSDIAAPFAAAADVATLPYRFGMGVVENVANAIGVPRLGRALGIYDPDVTRVEIPGAMRSGKDFTPVYDKARMAEAQNQPIDEAGYLKLLKEKDATAPKGAKPSDMTPQIGTPTKRGSQYDAAKTPFEPLIAQAATQNGIDPTVFKRLIGSESSFKAAPKPPTDSKGPIAFGIAQIHRMHIESGAITMEQAMDPATALPFAAQLFAGYLQKAGGDYGRALQMYKGASSEKGKAAMAGPINDVLAGTPYAVAPAELKARVESPATDLVSGVVEKAGLSEKRKMKPSEFYLGGGDTGTDRITYDAQQLQSTYETNRELLVNQYRRMVALGDVANLGAVEAQIKQLEGGYRSGVAMLEGMDAIRKFEAFNDPRYLTAVLQRHTGITYQFQPYEDGDYEIIAVSPDGRQARKGKYSVADTASFAREKYDQAYREQKIAQQRETAKSNAEAAGKLAIEEVKGLYELRKQLIANNGKISEAMIQGSQMDLRVDQANGTTYVFRKDGSFLGMVDPGGVIKDSQGREIKQPPTVRQATGL